MFKNKFRHLYLFSLICGMVCGCSHLTPIYCKLLCIPAWTSLLLATDTLFLNRRQSAFTMWFFALGYFAVSLYWISSALLIDAQLFAWLIPLSALGLPAIFALFPTITTYIFPWPTRTYWVKIFLLCCAWILSEWLRSWVLTGFPWPLLGYITLTYLPIAENGTWASIYGLSLFVLLVTALPYMWSHPKKNAKILYTSFIVMLSFGGIFWGTSQVYTPNTYTNYKIRLVQPNIPQNIKWDALHQEINFAKLATLTVSAPMDDIDLVIWPESALTFLSNEEKAQNISTLLSPNTLLATGALSVATNAGDYTVQNSLIFIDDIGHIVETYHKHHLVPFGEYIPAHTWIEKVWPWDLKKITFGFKDFIPGTGPKTLHIRNMPPVSPLICYEVIFPGEVVVKNDPPQWILNITNDAWYGDSAAPYQHLEIARMRAIEERLPLVRVANNGISAVVDPLGRIIAMIPLNAAGIIDIYLPSPYEKT